MSDDVALRALGKMSHKLDDMYHEAREVGKGEDMTSHQRTMLKTTEAIALYLKSIIDSSVEEALQEPSLSNTYKQDPEQ